MQFSREIKFNRLSGAIDIGDKKVDSIVNAAVENWFVKKSLFPFIVALCGR